MLLFSDVFKWEGDDAVQQILVFPNVEVQKNFEEKYNDPERKHTTSNYPDENDIGAIYKLRAVMNNDKRWSGVIRCGFTGRLINESNHLLPTPELALRSAMHLLAVEFATDCAQKIRVMEAQSKSETLSDKPQFTTV